MGQPGRPGKTAHTSVRLVVVAVPTAVPSTSTCTPLIAVPTVDASLIAQPETVTVPETVAPGAGASMWTDGITMALPIVTVTLDEPVSGGLAESVAETVMVYDPAVSAAVLSEYENPTLGQPGRPGKTAHTSGRLVAGAVPTAIPSTSTCTLLIAVPIVEALSIAQPEIVTVPDTVAPGAGASMWTDGITAGAVTVTVTLDEPVSVGVAESVAETVMVCDPVVSAAVFSE